MCSLTWETYIPSDMSSPTWETYIPSDMFSPTWETYIPSDMCSRTWETHIPSDMCSPPGKHISLVRCVPLPGKHISLVICVPLLGKHISLVICVPLCKSVFEMLSVFEVINFKLQTSNNMLKTWITLSTGEISIHWIVQLPPPPPNIYPLLDSDLSGGLGYPAYKQLGPGRHVWLQAGFCWNGQSLVRRFLMADCF